MHGSRAWAWRTSIRQMKRRGLVVLPTMSHSGSPSAAAAARTLQGTQAESSYELPVGYSDACLRQGPGATGEREGEGLWALDNRIIRLGCELELNLALAGGGSRRTLDLLLDVAAEHLQVLVLPVTHSCAVDNVAPRIERATIISNKSTATYFFESVPFKRDNNLEKAFPNSASFLHWHGSKLYRWQDSQE